MSLKGKSLLLEVLKKKVRNMTLFLSTNVLRRKISLKSLILL
ncbi:hypothetical protein NC652_008383 [Populus alba x Populus x berolinensis]|nr:hypothetical protein NC652_008383 [Populus alba x Populus x berolinensis]